MAKVETKEAAASNVKMTCGIIMPIASHPDYPSEHWKDVLAILNEAILETEFDPKLVSDDVAIGLIHDRIVTNIYTNEIVVCDVSSKNPNVMFELGLRLAFDKPTIIVKDENTGYSFDTGVIEHIPYPSSLRFSQIVKFKEELVRRINATYLKSKTEANYSPFLKSFGKTITPALLHQTEIPEGKYILNQLEEMRRDFLIMRMEQRSNNDSRSPQRSYINSNRSFEIKQISDLVETIIYKYINSSPPNEFGQNDERLLNIVTEELKTYAIEIPNRELRLMINNYLKKDKG